MKPDKTIEELKNEIDALEKEKDKNNARLSRQIKKATDEMKDKIFLRDEKAANEFIKTAGRFFLGNKVVGHPKTGLLYSEKDIVVLTGEAQKALNGNHQYTQFPCVRVGIGYSMDANEFTMKKDKVSAQELRNAYQPCSKDEFAKVFNEWQNRFRKIMFEELQNVPEIGSLKLLQ